MIFIFEANKKNNLIKICIRMGANTVDLGYRKHNITIFLLARQKAKDILSGLDSSERGLLYKDWLAEQLQPDSSELIEADFSTINQHFSRFKRILNEKIPQHVFDELIEHRTMEKEQQVRFVPNDVVIIEEGKTTLDTSNIRHNTEPKQSSHKHITDEPLEGKFKFTNTLIIAAALSIIALSLLGWRTLTKGSIGENIQTFVFLEPVFSDEFDLEQALQFQVRENIEQAVFDYAAQMDNIEFVEVLYDKSPDILVIGQQFSVDSVLSAQVDCNASKYCEFTFKQHDISDFGAVKNSFNLPLTFDEEQKIYWGIQFRLDAMFQLTDRQTIAPPQGVDSGSLETFIHAFSLWKKGHLDNTILNDVDAIRERFPNWHFASDSFGLMLIDMHRLTENTQWLHRLRAFVEKRTQSHKNSTHQKLFAAYIEQFSGNPDKALRIINEAIETPDSNLGLKEAEIIKARLLIYLEDWHAVVSLFTKRPMNSLPERELVLLLSAHTYLGNIDTVNSIASEFLEIYPQNDWVRSAFNKTLLEADASIQTEKFDHSSSTYPQYIDRNLHYALQLFLQGHEEIGLKIATDITHHFPRNLNAITTLGELQLLSGQDTEAAKTFSKVFDYSHEKFSLNYNLSLAFAYALNNQKELAEQIFHQAVRTPEKNAAPHIQLRLFLFQTAFNIQTRNIDPSPITLSNISKKIMKAIRYKLTEASQ
jgi:tetratricopeptide (TPR) repeat protein